MSLRPVHRFCAVVAAAIRIPATQLDTTRSSMYPRLLVKQHEEWHEVPSDWDRKELFVVVDLAAGEVLKARVVFEPRRPEYTTRATRDTGRTVRIKVVSGKKLTNT